MRALLRYVEGNDSEWLKKINKYQKVYQYDPGKFRGLLSPLKELERQLANVFEPHPGRIADRIEDIYQFLNNISQIVSPRINSQLRYLLSGIENQNPLLIQTNIEILINLLQGASQTAERLGSRLLFENLKEKITHAAGGSPDEIIVLINEWRQHAVSLFFPGFIDSLERLIAFLRGEDALNATLMLGDLRMWLRQKIINPLQQSRTNAVILEAIWLDLTLERIGYTLFGEVSNVLLADISIETLSYRHRCHPFNDPEREGKRSGNLAAGRMRCRTGTIKQSGDLNFYTLYSVAERINAEIGAIIDKTVETYYDLTKRIFSLRQVPNAEEAASAFVDGLFRSTTLQHLSELTLKLLNFSRKRMTELMKRVRHPSIREISYAKGYPDQARYGWPREQSRTL